MLHPWIKYRHLILTVPEALGTLIYQHPKELLDGLMKAAQTAMDEAMAIAKRQPIKAGYIVVLQTAGRAATYNPHLHVLMTDGGLTGEGAWQVLGYIPYVLLHRRWQAQVLTMMEMRLVGDAQAQGVVAKLWQRYSKGFVAHLQGDVLPRMSQLTRYIVKYVVSPPIALSRIIRYDRERIKATLGRDPQVCPRCGAEIWLSKILTRVENLAPEVWSAVRRRRTIASRSGGRA